VPAASVPAVQEALISAGAQMLWEQGGRRWRVQAYPLVPDEPPCS
jgi:hypothetical protein